MCLCSSQCQRAGTGQVRAGVCGEGVRAYAFITCLPHRPPDPSQFTPPASFFPPRSLLPRCAWRRVAVMEDPVTRFMTAAVILSYQLHRLTDTLTNSDPSFYSAPGNVCCFQHYPLPLVWGRPPFLFKTSTYCSGLCQTQRIIHFLLWVICCTLQCSTVNVCSLPGCRVNLPCKKSPSGGKLHWSQLCQISFKATWGGIKWSAVPGTGCLGWGRIRWGSPWPAGVLGSLRGSLRCFFLMLLCFMPLCADLDQRL